MSNSVTPWTAAHQATLSFTISRSLLKFTSIESVMLSNHLILCHSLLFLPSIFPRISSVQFNSIQSLSHVWLFATPQTAACQASLSITNFQRLLKFMSIEPMMPSNHLILCHPLLLPPSIFPGIRVFSNESALHIRWNSSLKFSTSQIRTKNDSVKNYSFVMTS